MEVIERFLDYIQEYILQQAPWKREINQSQKHFNRGNIIKNHCDVIVSSGNPTHQKSGTIIKLGNMFRPIILQSSTHHLFQLSQ